MATKASGWRAKGSADAAGGDSWFASADPTEGYAFVEHFISAGTQNSEIFTTVSGAAATASVASETGAMGIVTLSTGTTTGGSSTARTAATGLSGPAGTESLDLSFRFRIPTLSDGTETHALRIGFGDNIGSDHTDGAYLEIDSNSDAQAQCKTANNSTRTTVDSGVTIAANTWYTGRIVLTAASAIFTIDGSVVATITTNLPAAARTFGITASILKSAGTTARTADVDYFAFEGLY